MGKRERRDKERGRDMSIVEPGVGLKWAKERGKEEEAEQHYQCLSSMKLLFLDICLPLVALR